MKSFFNEILEKNNLSQHDGRPLWKYNFTEDDFQELKNHLSQINTYSYFDPRDITLYFAEWWKNDYNGGSPSILNIYKSINYCKIREKDFYKYAKKGAVSLGIRWIRKENKLYFRTLLLQGGLPIKHLVNPHYVGTYTRFLKKVLELNPNSIDEFMYEHDIISILPHGSRNDVIYESCLQIVEAIWNGNEEYLAILNTRGGSKISNELKEHKATIDRRIKKSSQFKAFWILLKQDNAYKIKLMFNFPNVIEVDNFSDLIDVSKEYLKSEYNLIVNDILVCKFRKNTRGNYKVFWLNNSSIFWDGKEMKPDVYLSSIEGRKHQFLIRFVDYPKLSIPTLWTHNSENEWILQKGKHCPQDDAFILYQDNWNFENDYTIEKINILDTYLNWCKFSNEIQLISNENELVTFKTKKTSFEWFVQEHKPEWVINSNLLIVSQIPRIIVYDTVGEQVKKTKLYWRLKGKIVWETWGNNLPVGCIEYKIIALDSEEQDIFYNIDNLKLDFKSTNSHEATINIQESNGLNLKIKKEKEEFEIRELNSSIFIKLNDNNKIPTSLKTIVSKTGQNRNLIIEIVPPFHGVTILDTEGNKLQDEMILLFDHLTGYRIYTPINFHHYYIKLYNTNRPYINVIKKLPNGITPLREYEEISKRLFRLTDAMDKNSSITIELIDEKDTLLSKYLVQNFNSTIAYKFLDEELVITTLGSNSENLTPSAIPLDCKYEEIVPVQLFRKEDTFILSDKSIEKFIVVSEYDDKNNSILLPAFVSNDKENIPTNIIDRQLRVEKNKSELELQNYDEPSWQKVKKYFDICIEYDLPFSTFDFLRASCSTPELIAKMFCYLSIYEDKDFIDKTCQILEEDLGFAFHWVPKKYWGIAIQWLEDSFKNSYSKIDTELIIQGTQKNIQELINDSEPMEWFSKIADYVSSQKTHIISGFHFNFEVKNLRQRLSHRVLNELPEISPQIMDEFKAILPVTRDNFRVKILLKAPLAVALSISGIDERIWSNDEGAEIVRRNIKYAQWISPDWYGKAIVYSLYRLKNY